MSTELERTNERIRNGLDRAFVVSCDDDGRWWIYDLDEGGREGRPAGEPPIGKPLTDKEAAWIFQKADTRRHRCTQGHLHRTPAGAAQCDEMRERSLAMYAAVAQEGRTLSETGKMFNVGPSDVGNVVRREGWKRYGLKVYSEDFGSRLVGGQLSAVGPGALERLRLIEQAAHA